MGGSIGGSAGAAAKNVQRQKYAADEKAKEYKTEKIDPQTQGAQENFGEVTGDAYNSFQMGMEGIGDFVERNTRSLMPQDKPDVQTTDTTTRNYTSASTSKSGGKGNKKGKKTSEGGTGGSKSQFVSEA